MRKLYVVFTLILITSLWLLWGQIPPVGLEWDASTSADVDGYNVYRSQTSGSGYTKLNTALVTVLTFDDDTIQEGQTYYYVATAVRDGLESDFSNELQVDVPWSTPPAAPGDLRLIQQGAFNFLRWEPEQRASGYRIQFSNDQETWSTVYNTPVPWFWFWSPTNWPPRFISVQSYLPEGLSERAIVGR